jgi:hypothetical protein
VRNATAPDDLPAANGVYRTPGRAAPPERIARPKLRTLLGPVVRAVAAVALVVTSVAVFDAIGPAVFRTSGAVRFIPSVDWTQDGLALALPLSLIGLLVLIARRVRPSWGGLRFRGKVLYVVTALLVQAAVVVAGEAAMFYSRGGLHLFGPSHLTSRWLPDGRTAHVYTRGGLQCGYDVFVSGPLALTATHAFELSRSTCLEPVPRVRANPDGSLDLVDASDKPLESQASPSFSFGGGC